MKNFERKLTLKFKTRFKVEEDMSKHTTFKIGGKAKYFVVVNKTSELIFVLKLCAKFNINYFIIGAGSNLLVSDNGFNGIVISMQNFNKINFIKNNKVEAFAGARIVNIVNLCAKNCLGGLEWAINIPGTIGGAVVMNAGAFNNQISDYIDSVLVLDKYKLKVFKKENLFFDYRKSIFTNQKKYVIIKVTLNLLPKNFEEIVEQQKKYIELRLKSQQVKFASAGSIFKRTPNFSAAELVDKAGLKGLCIGGAMVSKVHSGYIVNTGNATANDVLTLINIIKEKVFLKFGETLETEIVYLGENNETTN